MSISIPVPTNGYADFVTVVNSLRHKGIVYYFNNAPTTWTIFFTADDGSYFVELPGASGTFPASFSTDFPNAIALTVAPSTWSIG